MTRLLVKISFLFILLILLSIQGTTSLGQENQIQPNQTQFNNEELSRNLNIDPDFGKIPLYFTPNEGQVDERALFYAKTSQYTLWLTKGGLVFDSTKRIKKESTKSIRQNPRNKRNPEDFTYDRDVSRMVFVNANRSPEVIPMDNTEHKVNYFIGNNESKWRTNVQTSRTVLYKELYPDIDFKVYGNEKQIEYDFIVKPGGEVSDIIFEYKDVESTKIDGEGNLITVTKFGKLMQKKPVCYQVIEGERIEIGAEFRKIEMNTYGFEVKEYNGAYELIIDPLVLAYSTYLGGSGSDRGYGISVDSEGAAYITGYTRSADFPTKMPLQGSSAGYSDVFISKINPAGSALIYSTYLGGSGIDCGYGIAVGSEGTAYITGYTRSADFPTKNPIQGSFTGGEVFISKINPAGSALIYSTYLGGSAGEMGYGIAIDVEGAVYVTGCTSSADFPTVNPIQEWPEDGYDNIFVSKINPSGSALVYSTYLGYEWNDCGEAIAVDSEGAAYVTGYSVWGDYIWGHPSNAFVSKINPSGSVLDYVYEWGGYRYFIAGRGIAVDSEGAAYVTWAEYYLDEWSEEDLGAFVSKINIDGDNKIYTINLGVSGDDWIAGIAIDLKGAAYVTGRTDSDDFPIKNPIQDKRAGNDDGFIVKINPEGTEFEYSTYLGGSEDDCGCGIAVDSDGSAYVTGVTYSDDFPTQNPHQPSNAGNVDAFIAKLSFTSTYSLEITAGEGGTTRPKPGTHTYEAGTKAKIEAVPDEGNIFSHWSGDASGIDNPIRITMDSDKSVKANFIRKYALTISSGPGGITDPSAGTYTFDAGTEVTLTAIPESGYRFVGWSGDVSSTENPITITMNSDISIKANFIRQYSLALASGPGGTTQPSPGTYVYDEGTEVTISCIPDIHYRFSHWSGDESGTSDPLTITMDSDKSITANFIRIIYAPLDFAGQKVLNRSLFQVEYINFLEWQANSNNVSIVKYRIYQMEGNTQSLLVELNANVFDYWHRGVERDKQYTYALVAVNDEGREGNQAIITVQ